MKCYCHKENRYARGVLVERKLENGSTQLVFVSEKQQVVEVAEGDHGVCEKTVYTEKVVDQTFFEHFQEVSQLELTVIEFEESKVLTEKQRLVREEKDRKNKKI